MTITWRRSCGPSGSTARGAHKYDNVRIGLNGRLDTLQAAIVLAKLEIFDQEVADRQKVAERYSQALKAVVEVPYVAPECTSVWAQYSVLSDHRQVLQAKAARAPASPRRSIIPCPCICKGPLPTWAIKAGDFPVSEQASRRIFSLPMHPYLGQADQARIVQVLLT